jgi:DNA-binding NarL/FixJ family response regulator
VKRIRLLLVEDHELMSQGLRVLLEPEHRIVGVVSDGALVLAGVREQQPDGVLLDLALPHQSSSEILAELIEAHPALPVVVVTMHVEPIVADHALRLGAHGFVSKASSIEELRLAISEAMQGRRFRSDQRSRSG